MSEPKPTYTIDEALMEASRCLMCEDAPCETGCPARINVKEFIRKIRFEDFKGAARIIRQENILGGVCGAVCETDYLCKEKCSHTKLVSPIDIGQLQKFVIEAEKKNSPPEFLKTPDINKNVAIIGSGPAALSCAFCLRTYGYKVTIFERKKYPGGVLTYGIPKFRLKKDMVNYEIDLIKKSGVRIVANHEVTELRKLFKKGFKAVFIAAGLSHSLKLNAWGENLKGVFGALDILEKINTGKKVNLGRKIAVIGGGNVAMDAASAITQLTGKKEVTVIYRRTEQLSPAWKDEIQTAKNLGVNFRFLTNPVEIIGKKKVEYVKLQQMYLGQKDSTGRQKPMPIKGSDFVLPFDSVILALGEKTDVNLLKKWGLKVSSDGFVRVNKDRMTNIKGVFAGGDILGGSLTSGGFTPLEINIKNTASTRNRSFLTGFTVVKAVQDGKIAASGINNYLKGSKEKKDIFFSFRTSSKPDLSVDFCGIKLENPFILAAAPPTDSDQMVASAFEKGWAGAVLKTTSVESTSVDLKYPMMSGINLEEKRVVGLGNIDLISEHHIDVVEKRVKKLKKEYPNKLVAASIMGSKREDWQSLVQRLESAGVDLIECSFSCPQGTLGSKPGFMLGQDPRLVRTVAYWIKRAAKRVPVVIKITPQVTDIVEVARAVKESGADAICASNTIPSLMGVDIDTFLPIPNVNGKSSYSGYSGPAIKPITLRTIAEIAKHVNIPITGTGGPVTWKDAIEFMLVGAHNVQFCTAVMHYGYDIINDLRDGLFYYLAKMKLSSPKELIGKALQNITTHDELPYEKRVVSSIDINKCVRDNLCYITCRDGGHQAIELKKDRTPKVDEEKCVGCGLCLAVCPVKDCISLKKI